jgi:hypothetical protein
MTLFYRIILLIDCCDVIEVSHPAAVLGGSYVKQTSAESGRDYYLKTSAGDEKVYLYWRTQSGNWMVSTGVKLLYYIIFYKMITCTSKI